MVHGLANDRLGKPAGLLPLLKPQIFQIFQIFSAPVGS